MYWRPSMRKFGPLSDGCRYVASVIAPTTVPALPYPTGSNPRSEGDLREPRIL